MTASLKLGQLLVARGFLHPDQLSAALGAQRGGSGRLGSTLVEMGAIDEEQLVRVLAEQLGVRVARIRDRTIGREVVELMPSGMAEKHRCIPLFLRDVPGGDVLVLGMEDPSDEAALDEVRERVGLALEPVLMAPSEVEAALDRHYRDSLSADDFDPMAGSVLPPMPMAGSADDTATELPLPPLAGAASSQAQAQNEPASLAPLAPAAAEPWQAVRDDPALDDDSLSAAEEALGGAHAEPFREAPEATSAVAPSAAAAPGDEEDSSPDRNVSSSHHDAVLQAVAQLLVEKGLISRDEFADRLRKLIRKAG